jgi:hypothetical protein
MKKLFLSVLVAAVIAPIGYAQAPTPIVVQAMTPATKTQSTVSAAVSTTATQTMLKALQAMKAANDEILKQQEATLLKLDEMEKAANELRIYTKRG